MQANDRSFFRSQVKDPVAVGNRSAVGGTMDRALEGCYAIPDPECISGKMDAVAVQDMYFPSWDGMSTIHGCVWYPSLAGGAAGKPKGVVQLIHGMSEHIGRYDRFARYLAACGYAVFGHDHIGHGHSVSADQSFGHMPPETGADVLVEDVNTVRGIAGEAFPDAPYFMFGHSMGSYTLRVYLTRYGEGLAGAAICGTGNEPVPLAIAGNALARMGARLRGETSNSDLIHSLADGAFVKMVEDPQTEFDWISFDRGNIDGFLADELSGFQFTYGGYASLTRLALLAANLELARRVPSEVPLLFVSGAEDPVGNNGKGVLEAVNLMIQAGSRDVEVILYENMRHEILNEAASDEVFADILGWLRSHGR